MLLKCQFGKMFIRAAIISDSDDLLDWRNDKESRDMSFDSSCVSDEEHDIWFRNSLDNPDREIFIAECDGVKLGACRFDFDALHSLAEVSININPLVRGRGVATEFLSSAVEMYLDKNNSDLIARIKSKNLGSIKVFTSVGFSNYEKTTAEIMLKRRRREVNFKEVGEEDVVILYNLLKAREHNISHENMPTLEEHRSFVLSAPYLHWVLVSDEQPIGSFYLQVDNSIGINILEPTAEIVKEIMRFIFRNYTPKESVKSKVPPYFFINVANSNIAMKKVLSELDQIPIQVSYRLNMEEG